MKTKEELLQSVYGAEYIHADINGWMKYGMYHPSEFDFYKDEVDRYGDMDLWRPKSLQGIDDNFGWISINSEKNLPKEGYVFWVKREGINSPLYKSEEFFNAQINKEWLDSYTHYQPIVKPNLPLHK